jgi:hypothetical protein
MRKQMMILFLLALTTFSLAGALAGLFINLILQPIWMLGGVYAGLAFIIFALLWVTSAFIVGLNSGDDDEA